MYLPFLSFSFLFYSNVQLHYYFLPIFSSDFDTKNLPDEFERVSNSLRIHPKTQDSRRKFTKSDELQFRPDSLERNYCNLNPAVPRPSADEFE